MATIKEIAMLAGVSRGTVDRVLNNRGSVSLDKESKVLEIAKALNYTPNIAGKTLAVRKKALKFGYILMGTTLSNPFFIDVVDGIDSRAAEIREFGVSVEIRFAKLEDPILQVKLIDELLDEGISGLAITPVNHPLVSRRICDLTESGFPVVTANTDIPGCGRIAYVGSDYFRSGQTAAGLMNQICGGSAYVGVVIGSPWVMCHSERLSGFKQRIEEEYDGIRIAGTVVNNDDDIESYIVTKQLLEANPEINALFLVAAGVVGACRAAEDLGLKGKLKIVGYDATEATKELIRSGDIAVTITQEPFVQGSKPLSILLDYVGMGIMPEKDVYHTSLGIVIKENL